jgi:hypothetical protein
MRSSATELREEMRGSLTGAATMAGLTAILLTAATLVVKVGLSNDVVALHAGAAVVAATAACCAYVSARLLVYARSLSEELSLQATTR